MTPEEELAWLRAELGMVQTNEEIAALKRAFGIYDQHARILLALKSGRLLTTGQLGDRLPSVFSEDRDDTTLVRTLMCRLRRALPTDAIQNEWGIGYRLTKTGTEAVASALERA